MRNSTLLNLLLAFFFTTTALAQSGEARLNWYLPQQVSYNNDIPTPASYLGFEPGEWHIRHALLVGYARLIAEKSPRVHIEQTGWTYERRPTLLLTITSPKNHARLEQIREEHLKLTDPAQSGSLSTKEMPSVILMGYSVHGNEPSGSNAVPVILYHLAAAEGDEIERLLDEVVILLDPSFNPDGLDRFAMWANSNRGMVINADPATREHNESWPASRTNHYWFDLNRDWMPVQHPESKARITYFQRWMPNVLTDHHEMGTNSTFFFQPGIPSRTHPLTPKKNQELTTKIGTFHSNILDANGSLYYTKESFDDFYYGKGSTYPDAQGSIGILFEQASSRGHSQKSVHGTLDFAFTIKNQFLTTLSTLKAGQEMREELLNYQRDFFRNALAEADKDPVKAYVFGNDRNRGLSYHLLDILDRHSIEVYQLSRDVTVQGKTFEKETSFILPLRQKQYTLIKGMFETRTQFEDSLFYDISSWTMPLAFHLPYAELDRRNYATTLHGARVSKPSIKPGKFEQGNAQTVAYAFEVHEYYATKVIYELLNKGYLLKQTSDNTTMATLSGTRSFKAGTILVPTGLDANRGEDLSKHLSVLAKEFGVDVFAVQHGLAVAGNDLGSRSHADLRLPKLLLVVGDGVSQYDAGETWHLLDARFGFDVSLIEAASLSRVDLSNYNTIIMSTGSYSTISKSAAEEMKRWLRNGGVLIAAKGALNWLQNNEFVKLQFKSSATKDNTWYPYSEMSDRSGAQGIGGALFNVEADLTHPLLYGFDQKTFAIFRNSTQFLEIGENQYAVPVRYTSNPLLSGYISKTNAKNLGGTAAVMVKGMGSGRIIMTTDNLNFRAFWFGTNRLFLNSIFYGHTISGASAR